ncbi:LTA synthase family protein [Xylanibacillus composti]|uniref:Phosphoglycerol transferase n=1 Tax=Xylanibacillus composti TaxID=1572762 RepID=A0A8J4H122_9BACL|nr:LTA synthase family protein [Xylanibacillus composti]MDT9725053.1 LTA synthase family protein [Xylanibacillus composti]GIQ67467.1 phosphoglycerol transferase [Xylanibacillus composti]
MLGKDLSELRRSESLNRLSHWRLFALATIVIWLNTYVVQRYYFDLSITGLYQEWMMLINPLGSTMLMLGIAFLIFRRRQHIAALAVSFLTSALLAVNIWYFRFYNDFITLPVLYQKRNTNGLGSSVVTILEWFDLFIFTGFFVLLFLLYGRRRIRVQLPRPQLYKGFAVIACLLLITWAMAEVARPQLLSRSFDRQLIVKNIGTMNYHLYDLVMNSRMETRRVFADSTDMESAQSYLAQRQQDVRSPLFGAAEGKNVFLISMESLQGFVMYRELNGQAITPYLNALAQDSYYFDQFYHQTGQGKTSDSEFIVDNSMFALPSGAVFFTHTQNRFLATPQILKKYGYTSASFHANDATFWNRDLMYDTLGYDHFFDKSYYEVTEENSVGWGLRDKDFFEQSMPLLQQLPQPFYAKFISLTNHFPYEYEPEDALIDPAETGDASVDNYFVTVRYFDEALKHFMEQVKDAGLYEDSIFILYGDHYGISENHKKAMAEILGREITPYEQAQLQRVPLIIHIPGHEGKTLSTVGGQIDVRPTLLHLLGITDGDHLSFGYDLFAENRVPFAIFRDGSFVNEDHVYTSEICYNRADGSEIELAACEPGIERAGTALNYSDEIIYGDLLRFILDDAPTNAIKQ